jgi:hypothetical protein
MVGLGVLRIAPVFYKALFGLLISDTIPPFLMKVLGLCIIKINYYLEGLKFNYVLFYSNEITISMSNHIICTFLDSKIDDLIESGMVEQMKDEFGASDVGYQIPSNERNFTMCLKNNEISNIQNAYMNIKLENMLLFLKFISGFYTLLVIIFGIHLLLFFINFQKSIKH